MRPPFTIPNFLSAFRILLVPVFLYLFSKHQYEEALVVLVIAGVTDFLDGLIARKFHMRSKLGSILDPAADKLLMLGGYLVLSFDQRIPWHLTLIIIGRDVGISLGVLFLNLLRIKLLYRPTILSKITTFCQITVLALCYAEVILEHHPLFNPLDIQYRTSLFLWFFIVAASLLTLITAAQYALIGYRFYRYGERR